MNIYQRQMRDLGLDIDQYSQMLEIPKSITKKIVNGNGEVVKNNMEINNFLRKNLFNKHQEVEKNKEEKKVETLNVKLIRGENSYESKKKWLLENYPESKEVQWYINEYDRDTYFAKNNIKNKADLMRRYNFSCNVGRLKKQEKVGISTIDRLVNKQYDELGIKSAYPLICQLYNCLELGYIEDIQESKKDINTKKGVRGFQKKEYTEEEQNLRKWFSNFDLEEFITKNGISYKSFSNATGIAKQSIYSVKLKKYIPSCEILRNMKEFVSKFEPVIIPDERTAIVSEESIMRPFESVTVTGNAKVFDIPEDRDIMKLDNAVVSNGFITTAPIGESTITPLYNESEEMLRNLLINRLTEEEKMLIKLFGGKIEK